MEASYLTIVSYIACSILFISLGYIFGSLKAVNDDIKLILYDKLVIENKELKSTIENMMQIKKRKNQNNML